MKLFLCAVMIFMLLFQPQDTSAAARNALSVWALDLVPSLFPFMVLCQTLSAHLTRTNHMPIWLVCALGMLGGSPCASASLSGIYAHRPIRPRTLLSLSALTGTISPMFFLGTVSSWLNSGENARKLLAAHLCGAATAAMIIWCISKDADLIALHPSPKPPAYTESPIAQSVSSILNVGGCIVFFSVAAHFAGSCLPFFSKQLRSVLHAALEISGGLRTITLTPFSETTRLVLCAAVSGFSGFSILTQNHLFLSSLGITRLHLILFGFLRAAASACIMAIIV